MRVSTESRDFQPVVITLESQDELEAVYNALSIDAVQDTEEQRTVVADLERLLEDEIDAAVHIDTVW